MTVNNIMDYVKANITSENNKQMVESLLNIYSIYSYVLEKSDNEDLLEETMKFDIVDDIKKLNNLMPLENTESVDEAENLIKKIMEKNDRLMVMQRENNIDKHVNNEIEKEQSAIYSLDEFLLNAKLEESQRRELNNMREEIVFQRDTVTALWDSIKKNNSDNGQKLKDINEPLKEMMNLVDQLNAAVNNIKNATQDTNGLSNNNDDIESEEENSFLTESFLEELHNNLDFTTDDNLPEEIFTTDDNLLREIEIDESIILEELEKEQKAKAIEEKLYKVLSHAKDNINRIDDKSELMADIEFLKYFDKFDGKVIQENNLIEYANELADKVNAGIDKLLLKGSKQEQEESVGAQVAVTSNNQNFNELKANEIKNNITTHTSTRGATESIKVNNNQLKNSGPLQSVTMISTVDGLQKSTSSTTYSKFKKAWRKINPFKAFKKCRGLSKHKTV